MNLFKSFLPTSLLLSTIFASSSFAYVAQQENAAFATGSWKIIKFNVNTPQMTGACDFSQKPESGFESMGDIRVNSDADLASDSGGILMELGDDNIKKACSLEFRYPSIKGISNRIDGRIVDWSSLLVGAQLASSNRVDFEFSMGVMTWVTDETLKDAHAKGFVDKGDLQFFGMHRTLVDRRGVDFGKNKDLTLSSNCYSISFKPENKLDKVFDSVLGDSPKVRCDLANKQGFVIFEKI